MTVTNRKMFNRGARNKVRQMGGIMASSEPLMQEVAKFQFGGNISLLPSIVYDQQKGSRDQSEPYDPNKGFLDALDAQGGLSVEIGRLLYENPAQALGLLAAVPGVGGLAFKGGKLTAQGLNLVKDLAKRAFTKPNPKFVKPLDPSMPGPPSLSNLQPPRVFSPQRTAGTVGGLGLGAYLGQDIVNPLIKEGIPKAITSAPGVVSDAVKGIPSAITGADEAIKQAFNIEGPSRSKEIQADTASVPFEQGAFDTKAGIPSEVDRQRVEEIQKLLGDAQLSKGLGVTQEQFDDFQDTVERQKAEEEINQKRAERARKEREGQEAQIYEETQKRITEGSEEAASGDSGGSKKTQRAIENLFKTGSETDRKKMLDQFVTEFKEDLDYGEGVDPGLAIAKIGFAMAAGESPNAIVNIANALKDGASDFIKEDQKRKDFERQIDISAKQYGLAQLGKLDENQRAIQRIAFEKSFDMEYFVVEDPDSKLGYKEIAISKAELARDGLPEGALRSSFAEKLIKNQKDISDLIPKLKFTDKDEYVNKFTEYSTNVRESTNAIDLLQRVMVSNAKCDLTGFDEVFYTAAASAAEAVGLGNTIPKRFNNRKIAERYLRQVFQKLVPLTLGKDQSANSISDKDVQRLADAFLDAGVMDGGLLALATTPSRVLNASLQATMKIFKDEQAVNLAKLTDLEQNDAVSLFYGTKAVTDDEGNTKLVPKPLGEYVTQQRKIIEPFLSGQVTQERFGGRTQPYFGFENNVYKLIRPGTST